VASETARIEAFSDGVFAIAVTLLILEVKIPAAGSGRLGSLLLHQWPSYLAFLLSFAFIGIMWINHHRMFNHIRRADEGLLILNLLLLLGVTAVPFPTAVLAVNLRTTDARVAALLYNGTYVVIAIFFNVLWRYALAHHLLGHEVNRASAEKISRQYAGGPILYLVCLAIAWFSVTASLILNIALAIFFALPPSAAERVRRGAGAGDEAST
jgi:uncharacterized membrane protein